MYKIGLSSCGKVLEEKLFSDYAENGIDAIEISPAWNEFKMLNYNSLHKWSRQYGVTLWSFHLPFPTTDICSTNRGIRVCSVEYMCELIKQGAGAGIKKFVIHAGLEPVSFELKERAEKMACSQESLNQLAEFAAEYDAVICVEDLPRSCLGNSSDEILELISVNDKLRVCLDTNHLLKEDNIDFIKRVGNKIETLHVSDYDYVDEKHWLPGEGKIHWQRLIEELKNINYQGVWMYEIGFKCPASMKRSRDLCCADFTRNARELFNNEKLTIIV